VAVSQGRVQNRAPVPDQPSPKSRIDKLGVRPGSRVSVLGAVEGAFLTELGASGADVSHRRRKASDLIFLPVERSPDLEELGELEPYMERDGAVWAVFPKGRKDLPEVDVIRAGVEAGLVDNKVVRFSDSHTALRFVIPVTRR